MVQVHVHVSGWGFNSLRRQSPRDVIEKEGFEQEVTEETERKEDNLERSNSDKPTGHAICSLYTALVFNLRLLCSLLFNSFCLLRFKCTWRHTLLENVIENEGFEQQVTEKTENGSSLSD